MGVVLRHVITRRHVGVHVYVINTGVCCLLAAVQCAGADFAGAYILGVAYKIYL